jgi:hypothetical protein
VRHSAFDGRLTERRAERPGPSLAQAADAVAREVEAGQPNSSSTHFSQGREARRLREQVRSKNVKLSRKLCKYCRQPILLIEVNAQRGTWNAFNDPDCTIQLCRRN